MPKYTVKVVGEKAAKTKKGKWMVDGLYETNWGMRHVKLGLNKEPMKGDTLEVEGEIFQMPQDALWERDAKAPAAL